MSEGNCNCCCCCAYLNPPWWVTMGYAPGAGGSRIQNPPATAGFPARPQPPTGAGGGGGARPVVAVRRLLSEKSKAVLGKWLATLREADLTKCQAISSAPSAICCICYRKKIYARRNNHLDVAPSRRAFGHAPDRFRRSEDP